jgi:thioredoxin reductase (NADPH)
MYDVLVVGGGPAGMTAAIYLQRFKLNVIVIAKDHGALSTTTHIENYYGFEHPITGKELIESGIAQARRLGVTVIEDEEVLTINALETFDIKTNKAEYNAKSVLLATGMGRPNLRVKGFTALSGKGISFCGICDGFLYRNKKIGLLGAGEFMAEELEVLKNFTDDLIIFTNGETLKVSVSNLQVVTEPLIELLGTDYLTGVKTKNGEYPIDALFIAAGTPSASDFAVRMGAFVNPKSEIEVDASFSTNIPGLYAAGDCIGGLWQISKAVGDGANAALAINKYLKSKTS